MTAEPRPRRPDVERALAHIGQLGASAQGPPTGSKPKEATGAGAGGLVYFPNPAELGARNQWLGSRAAQHRLDRDPFAIAEFIARDWKLQFGG
jgi:hypothetical protein